MSENPTVGPQAEALPLPTRIIKTVREIYQNITVEPLIICWLLPFLVTYAAIENMNFEKACRQLLDPTTGFDKDVCKLFVRKDQFSIDCTNGTQFETVKIDDIKAKYGDLYESIKDNLTEVFQFLCDVEDPVQEKISTINSIRNPIASIGPLIIVLFAGPWSDKKNLRVPCMLVPYLGEAVGYLSLFITAIFINGPVEIPAYAYRLIPSLTGAENLMIMGIFSYLTAVSSEENRTLRFGMFQMLLTIIPIVAQLISPSLIKRFDYAELFGAMIPFHIIGFLYAIFYLKEPAKQEKKEQSAYDNEGMTIEMTSTTDTAQNRNDMDAQAKSSNACAEFFDPRHAIYCIRSFIKKRKHHLRTIIIIFMLMHFLTYGITQGETQNLFLYVRSKLNWDVDFYVYHNVFTIVMGLIGTSIAIGILSKLLNFADITLIIVSTVFSIFCRGIYIFAKTTIQFFSGTAIDFMYSVRSMATRSTISKIVPAEDLSTMFAIMGLFEALSGILFPYVYPTFYTFLYNDPHHDISEIYILSLILLVISLGCFMILWKLLRNKEDADSKESKVPDATEITKL